MMSSPRLPVAGIGLALLAAMPLVPCRAQGIGGVVRDSRTRAPIAGAVVSVVDARGVATRQVVTDRAGSFALTVSDDARRLVVRRIGFLPLDESLPDSAHATRIVREIVLQPIPVTLAPVTASEAACRRASGAQQALAFFEQARSGVLASIVARQTKPALMRLASTRRIGPSEKNLVQSVKVVENIGLRPFRATLDPDALVARGFVSQSPQGLVYHGLDPDLLKQIQSILLRHRGTTPVYLSFNDPSGKKTVIDPGDRLKVQTTDELLAALEDLVGENAVKIR